MIQGFDSLDAMFDEMAQAEHAANDRMTAAQCRIRDAADQTVYFARAFHDGSVVYGFVPPALDKELRARGYLTGDCYSSLEPDGEFGDTHASEVIPISERVFQVAQAEDYPPLTALSPLLRLHLRRAVKQAAA